MNNDNKNNRRNFLKTAGAALVAASVPVAVSAQNANARPGCCTNNLKQIGIAALPAAPNPNLPGIFGMASISLQLFADLGGGGYGVMSDPVFSEINSHIRIVSTEQTSDTTYLLRGTIERSQSSDLVGKPIVIRSQVLDSASNCNLKVEIETSTVLIGLLVPAVQSAREAARR